MKLPSTPNSALVDHLGQQYFNTVWNAPGDHGQANIALTKASTRLATGAVPVNLSVVALPTTDAVYATYRAPVSSFGKYVNFPQLQWVTDTQLVHDFSASVIAYASSGRRIPTGKIWLRYDPYRSTVLIAVDRTYTSQCLGIAYPDLYLTTYLDTSRNTPIVSQIYQISTNPITPMLPSTVAQTIHQTNLNYPHGTIVFVNGWMYDPTNVPVLTNGDVVEIWADPDIIGSCLIGTDTNEQGYHSQKFGEYREILHLPKSLNPDGIIFTHDLLLLTMVDPITGRGVYGHRLDPHAVESITHQDFSVSRSVLDDFTHHLGSASIAVRVYVRSPTQPRTLKEDANHLSSLYSLTDQDIVGQLAGLSQKPIAQWQAAHLEQSSFLDLLYSFPSLSHQNMLDTYVSAMGYYDVSSKISQSVHYHSYTGSAFTITKPTYLFGSDCAVLAYTDGRKIPESQMDVANHSLEEITIGFHAGGYVQFGSRLCLFVTEGGTRTPISFTPTLANPSLPTNSDDYQVVQIISYPDPQPVWKDTVVKGYLPLAVSPGDYHVTQTSTGAIYTFGMAHYDQSFYLIPRCGTDTIVIPLDTKLQEKQALVFSLQTRDGSNSLFPLVGYQSLEVYLNGNRLTEGLDYSCTPCLGDQGDVLQTLMEVSCSQYLDLTNTGNLLEIVVSGNIPVSTESGFSVANQFYLDNPPVIWSASCGRAFAGGLLLEHVTQKGNLLLSQTPVPDGTPFLTQWTQPYGATKLLAGYDPVPDTEFRTRIDALLGETPPTVPSTLVITNLHALYSPYLAAIIKDVSTGNFIIVDEPKDDMFLRQFKNYQWLSERDPLLGSSDIVDHRFVSAAAHYSNFTVTDATQLNLVQRLISLYLTLSALSIREVLI